MHGNRLTRRFFIYINWNSKQYNIKNYLGEQQYAGVETALNLITNTSNLNNSIRAYSYTLYDKIGRITEVGELVTKAPLMTYKVETQLKYLDITASTGILNSGVRQQITRTYYDEAPFSFTGFTQENLRPRVACVTYSDRDNTNFQRATLYSYDVHGNVKELKQVVNK